MTPFSFTASSYLDSDHITSSTTTVDARYEKLKKEFLNWCTARRVRKHILDKTYIICLGCQNRAKKFDDIQHDKDCVVAIALELVKIFPSALYVEQKRYTPQREPVIQPPALPLWQHKDDKGVWGKVRECAPCPAVWPMQDSRVAVTKQWQFFIRAINPGMALRHVVALFGPEKAFTNRNVNDVRADYLKGENLDRPVPDFDKVRTCSLSVMTGTTAGDYLTVKMMNGNAPPILKPGKLYPNSVDEINQDDYLYTPRTHRHLFFAANITTADGDTVQFTNGAVYDWFGSHPVSWLPHVSRFMVHYPLSKLRKLEPGAAIPSPYI